MKRVTLLICVRIQQFEVQDTLNMARSYINHFGTQYLQKNQISILMRKCQEAHEAIRPSDVRALPESLGMEKDAYAFMI